jgi:hypothetical protein
MQNYSGSVRSVLSLVVLVAAPWGCDDTEVEAMSDDSATDDGGALADAGDNEPDAAGPSEPGEPTPTSTLDATAPSSEAGVDAGPLPVVDAAVDPGSDAEPGVPASADAGDAAPSAEVPDAEAPDASTRLCSSVNGPVVAVNDSGDKLAFVACDDSNAPHLVIEVVATGERAVVGPASGLSTLVWTMDGEHVLYGSAEQLSIASANGATFVVSEGGVDDTRMFKERVSNTEFTSRLLMFETLSATKRVTIRGAEDGYASALVLLESPDLRGDLSQLSASGRTLLVQSGATEDALAYLKVRTNLQQPESTLPFTPAEWAMAPVGLGDTHNFALNGDQLVRIELDTGVIEELVPAASGLLAGTDHLLEREDAPGVKYVYYIQDGNPTRRIRDATEAPEVLADANAIAQTLTADLSTLLYVSDGQLFGVPAVGGTSVPLVADATDSSVIDVVFAPMGDRFAYVVDSTLYLGSGATAGVMVSDALGDSAPVFNAAADQLLFLEADGSLMQVTLDGAEASTLAEEVSAFWVLPGSGQVLVSIDGELVELE